MIDLTHGRRVMFALIKLPIFTRYLFMNTHPAAGKPVPHELLVVIAQLVSANCWSSSSRPRMAAFVARYC